MTKAQPEPTFELTGYYIELNKLMKLLGWVQTGGQAKILIQEGEVLRNGERELRVRAKLIAGDKIEWGSDSVIIVSSGCSN